MKKILTRALSMAVFSLMIFLFIKASLAAHGEDKRVHVPQEAIKKIEQYIQQRLAEEKFPSISIGIVREDGLVYSKGFGVADRKSGRLATPDTLYRIGSITKVFTVMLLAIMRERGEVALDDPVAKYLPPDVKLLSEPGGPSAITLRHLATHSSGLPRLPVNLAAKGEDPYGGFSVTAMYTSLAKTRLDFPVGFKYSYSNLGMGLLGHALERAAGEPYEMLLKKRIFEQLEMKHSTISLTDVHRKMMATGYKAENTQVEAVDWDMGCLAPAGGIAASVTELARFLSLQLSAGQANTAPVSSGTLIEMQTPQRLMNNWKGAVGLGWHIMPSEKGGDIVWHNGGMAGYHSFIGFSTQQRVGVIVLTNCGKSVDAIGHWLLSEAPESFGVKRQQPINPTIQKMAEALSKYFVKDPPDILSDLFHEQFLAAIPLTQIKRVFSGIFQENGPCKSFEVSPSKEPRHATIIFKFAGDKKIKCEVRIDTSNTPLLIYLRFLPEQ